MSTRLSPTISFRQSRRQSGVTLIELVTTIAVLAIILVLAVPSFQEFRERSVVKGAAEELVTQVSNFRFDAVKRNRRITISLLGTPGAADWCVGAVQGAGACDCNSTGASCNAGTYPDPGAGLDERRGAKLVSMAGFSADQTFGFDPATGMLTIPGQAGSVILASPSDSYGYQLRFDVNPLGRVSLCIPSGAPVMSGYRGCP